MGLRLLGDSVEPGQGVRVLMDTRERKRNPVPRGLLDRVQAHARFHVERTALRIGDYQVPRNGSQEQATSDGRADGSSRG